MTRFWLVPIAVAVFAGCQGPTNPSSTKASGENAQLILIGADVLSLGASPQQCQRAFPPPPDARDITDEVAVDPGLKYMAWELPATESFAAAFHPNKGAVKVIHRVVIENMEEAEDAFENYRKRLGRGTRSEGEDWIKVVYERANSRLVLLAKKNEDFFTFNEILEDLRLDRGILSSDATMPKKQNR